MTLKEFLLSPRERNEKYLTLQNKTTMHWKQSPWTGTVWTRHTPSVLGQYTHLIHNADLLLALHINNLYFKVRDFWMLERWWWFDLASREHQLRQVEKRAWVIVRHGQSSSIGCGIPTVSWSAGILPLEHGVTQQQWSSYQQGTVPGGNVSSLHQLNTVTHWRDTKGQVAFHFKCTVLFSRSENNGSVIRGYI